MDIKTGRQMYSEKPLYSFKVSPHKILINHKKENSNIIVEKYLADPSLTRVNTTNNETYQWGLLIQ